jgi:hypothetical protein
MQLIRPYQPATNQRVLVTDFDEFAGIALAMFPCTLLIPHLDGVDVIDLLRARRPNSPIDAAPSRKKQVLPNMHTIPHREAVPGACLFHPRLHIDATEARRSDRIPTFAALTARLYG